MTLKFVRLIELILRLAVLVRSLLEMTLKLPPTTCRPTPEAVIRAIFLLDAERKHVCFFVSMRFMAEWTIFNL